MFECKGPVAAEDAAQFNKALHDVLKKFKSKIVFDLTGPKDK